MKKSKKKYLAPVVTAHLFMCLPYLSDIANIVYAATAGGIDYTTLIYTMVYAAVYRIATTRK